VLPLPDQVPPDHVKAPSEWTAPAAVSVAMPASPSFVRKCVVVPQTWPSSDYRQVSSHSQPRDPSSK
jgi:hypothetical protein